MIDYIENVYVVMGIDKHAQDQVLAVCESYPKAKDHCIKCMANTEFYDLWIDKHPLI